MYIHVMSSISPTVSQFLRLVVSIVSGLVTLLLEYSSTTTRVLYMFVVLLVSQLVVALGARQRSANIN